MLFSTTAFAKEPFRNMTYEEWLEEQANNNSGFDYNVTEVTPVKIETNKNGECTYNLKNNASVGFKSLNSILEDTGKYELQEEVTTDMRDDSLLDGISADIGILRTAPTAGLIPIIVNEDSLIDGQITTDTIIAFLFNDSDLDSDTIVGRYVDGNAANYILGEIDGGFVIQMTVPGTYELYYQVEDSAGEFSRVIGYTFNVIEAPVVELYKSFEGSFTSADDSITYNLSVDFSEINSVAVCLVRKGYVGTNIKVYDEEGNQILNKGTGTRQAKNWGYIDKPSTDLVLLLQLLGQAIHQLEHLM